LAHSPTDIESYIRPGCIILTIYLRLAESAWEEVFVQLCSSGSNLYRTIVTFSHVISVYSSAQIFHPA